MIKTLVVDDDFRVAGIHAASLAKVQGFTCVGQAHTASAARQAIARLTPDLLLLDVYLPDENGISFLRSLQAAGTPVDAIVITAAQDVSTVRAAMSSGAIYYLIKPFGFEQLRVQLETYRRWREQLDSSPTADQSTIDILFQRRQVSATSGRKLQPTMQKIFDAVAGSATPVSAAEIADAVGVSRPTAQRYLGALEEKGLLSLEPRYGTTGRPVNYYAVK
ncbi:response regulator [Psychromicrobium xiongbiense]|uniref:response regulator n=1 Tax=Psychromicrobium xiongbiense TaxID=3051184 RepID=UPI002555691C|nr:response regulator [Psychromicrobium sp. YIM S02556]